LLSTSASCSLCCANLSDAMSPLTLCQSSFTHHLLAHSLTHSLICCAEDKQLVLDRCESEHNKMIIVILLALTSYTAFSGLSKPTFRTMPVNKACKHKYVSSGGISSRVAGHLSLPELWHEYTSALVLVPQVEATLRLSADLQLTIVIRDLSSGRQRISKQGGGAVVRQRCC